MMRQEATNSKLRSPNLRSWNPSEHYKEVAVAESYDATRFTSLAGRVFNWLEKRSIRKAIADIPVGAHIIDMPCGTGRLSELLLDLGYRVTGADISPAMLEVASRKLARFGDRFDTVVADARKAEMVGRQFDGALCARVLVHYPLADQVEFLKGVASVSRGPVVFTHSYSTPYQRMRRRLKRLLGHQAPVSYPVTDAELQGLLKEVGLKEFRRTRTLALISEAMTVATGRA